MTGALTSGLDLTKCGYSSKGIQAFGRLATTTPCTYAATAHGLSIKQMHQRLSPGFSFPSISAVEIGEPTSLCSRLLMAAGQVKEPGDCHR